MTFTRILRFHLNIHFLKTSVKNPKIDINKYKFMRFLFIKGILRALIFGLKILFIDETSFKLNNANYYQWRKKRAYFLRRKRRIKKADEYDIRN